MDPLLQGIPDLDIGDLQPAGVLHAQAHEGHAAGVDHAAANASVAGMDSPLIPLLDHDGIALEARKDLDHGAWCHEQTHRTGECEGFRDSEDAVRHEQRSVPWRQILDHLPEGGAVVADTVTYGAVVHDASLPVHVVSILHVPLFPVRGGSRAMAAS